MPTGLMVPLLPMILFLAATGLPLTRSESSPGAGDDAGSLQARTLTRPNRAMFRLDFDTLNSPGWPALYKNYSLFVCSPRLQEEHLQEVRAAIPGAKLIAYFDTQFAMIDKGCASSGGASYYRAFNEYFRPEWAITDLTTGLPICLQNKKGWAGTQPAGWVAFPAAVDAVARYHRDVTMNASWDGLYLDDAGSQYNPRFAAIVADSGSNFDVDGDGRPDSVATLVAQWQAFRPYLFRKLREVVGPHGILLANSGIPHSPDSSLSGITLEAESCHQDEDQGARFALERCHDNECRWTSVWANGTRKECLKAFEGQAAVSASPSMSLYWITELHIVPLLQQCADIRALARSLPAVQFIEGVDVSDTAGVHACDP